MKLITSSICIRYQLDVRLLDANDILSVIQSIILADSHI